MSSAFNSLPLAAEMLTNLESLGYHNMTEIQQKSLPIVLDGKDVIVKAKTGSGKTAAFGIGLLQRLQVHKFRIQALVLCPTRELAEQVAKELRRLARATHNVKILTLCGGTSIGPQIGSLEHGAHIIVGTPGRIADHLRKKTLMLDNVHTVVLDEADRMLDMGFAEEMEGILQECPSERQTLMFSATYPPQFSRMSSAYQKNPITIEVEAVHSHLSIDQCFYELPDGSTKVDALLRVFAHYQPESSLVFCNTKIACDAVCQHLNEHGIHALTLHGDMEQRDRNLVLLRFGNKSCPVLVATDVAARGLDIKELAAVISYDVSPDPEVHVHRIGRTGRAGEAGLAIGLVVSADIQKVIRIEHYLQQPLPCKNIGNLPTATRVNLPGSKLTLDIDGGKKEKIRAGDVLGALTAGGGLPGSAIGKIDITDFHTYVAIDRASARQALACLQQGKIKGRNFRARILN